MNYKKKYQYSIGVDPGRNTGVALYNLSTRQIVSAFTCKERDFEEKLIDLLQLNCQNKNVENIIIVIEDSNLDKTVFNEWNLIIKPRVIAYSTQKGSASIRTLESQVLKSLKKAQDVGKNKMISEIVISICKRLSNYWNLDIATVAPSSRNRADKKDRKFKVPLSSLIMPTKVGQLDFKNLTGYVGSTSEHARDASMLVFKQSSSKLNLLKSKTNLHNQK